jgi:hypothetical protein
MSAQEIFALLNEMFGSAAALIATLIAIVIILWRHIQKKDEKLENAFERLEGALKDTTAAHAGVGEALVKLSERLRNYNNTN